METLEGKTLLAILIMLVLLAGWQAFDYFNFRGAGARFTASDGTELCQSQRRLAEFVGYSGKLPECNYHERNQ